MSSPMKKHTPFIMDEVLPAIFSHSAKVGCDSVESALAVFMSLGTILLDQGLTAGSLLTAIQGSAMSTHDDPERVQ